MKAYSFALFLLLALPCITEAQEKKKLKNIFPLWTFHHKGFTIHGISLGLASTNGEERISNTNGIKVEVIGLFVPMAPSSPFYQSDSEFVQTISGPAEKVNGLSLAASGSVCNCDINGVMLGSVGNISRTINGVTFSVFMNLVHQVRGVQFSAFNHSYKTKGIQLGVVNHTKRLAGIQIGLWNVNSKRKMPFINWNIRA